MNDRIKVDNDGTRLRELADELVRVGKCFEGRIGDIQQELGFVMRRCEDDRISDFQRDFRKVARQLDEFHKFLEVKAKYLREKAEKFENFQEY